MEMEAVLSKKFWGTELLLEENKWYALKKITINKGHRTSLQRHLEKVETIYILSGKIQFHMNGEEKILFPGDIIHVNPGDVHRMTALETSETLESQSPHLNDVIRLEDDYQREGTQTRADFI